jgi:large subunit ribosomal protein L40e
VTRSKNEWLEIRPISHIDSVLGGSVAMQIFVKTLNGATKTLSLESSSSVREVKEAIESIDSIPADIQTLTFNGRCLEDARYITDYNIENQCTIQMSLSLNGGVFDPSLAALAKKFNCEKQVCRK